MGCGLCGLWDGSRFHVVLGWYFVRYYPYRYVVALTDNYEEPIMYIGSSFLRVVAMQDILFHESSLYLVPVPVVLST